MHFAQRTFRDALGGITIQSRLGPATIRVGFERRLRPGVEVGLLGWERAHSQGSGTGVESPDGILYAPSEVNQAYQRLGIERFLRELIKRKPDEVELWLTTVTHAHAGTSRLKEIMYRVDAVRHGRSRHLFEASIEVENSRVNPRVTIQATPVAWAAEL